MDAFNDDESFDFAVESETKSVESDFGFEFIL